MNNDDKDRLEIQAITRLLSDLMIKKDITAIDNIVDANFTLTHITGYVQSKSEWFSEIESESMKYYLYDEKQVKINVDKDMAHVTTQIKLDARIWGTRNIWNLQQNMELAKRNGKWIILKSVASIF